MKVTELMALILLAEDDPTGTYLLEESDGQRILWRVSEGEPEDVALAPAALWPLLLPDTDDNVRVVLYSCAHKVV